MKKLFSLILSLLLVFFICSVSFAKDLTAAVISARSSADWHGIELIPRNPNNDRYSWTFEIDHEKIIYGPFYVKAKVHEILSNDYIVYSSGLVGIGLYSNNVRIFPYIKAERILNIRMNEWNLNPSLFISYDLNYQFIDFLIYYEFYTDLLGNNNTLDYDGEKYGFYFILNNPYYSNNNILKTFNFNFQFERVRFDKVDNVKNPNYKFDASKDYESLSIYFSANFEKDSVIVEPFIKYSFCLSNRDLAKLLSASRKADTAIIGLKIEF